MSKAPLHCWLAHEKFRRELIKMTIPEIVDSLDWLYAYHVAFVDAVDSWILKQPPEVIESFNKKIKRKVETQKGE